MGNFLFFSALAATTSRQALFARRMHGMHRAMSREPAAHATGHLLARVGDDDEMLLCATHGNVQQLGTIVVLVVSL